MAATYCRNSFLFRERGPIQKWWADRWSSTEVSPRRKHVNGWKYNKSQQEWPWTPSRSCYGTAYFKAYSFESHVLFQFTAVLLYVALSHTSHHDRPMLVVKTWQNVKKWKRWRCFSRHYLGRKSLLRWGAGIRLLSSLQKLYTHLDILHTPAPPLLSHPLLLPFVWLLHGERTGEPHLWRQSCL